MMLKCKASLDLRDITVFIFNSVYAEHICTIQMRWKIVFEDVWLVH